MPISLKVKSGVHIKLSPKHLFSGSKCHKWHYSRIGGMQHWRRFALSLVSGSRLRRGPNLTGYQGFGFSTIDSFVESINDSSNGLLNNYHLKKTLKYLDGLETKSEYLSKSELLSYIQILRDCGKRRALSEGKHVHANIISRGLGRHKLLGNLLITMYGKCGSLDDAHRVFNEMPNRDVVTWNALIAAYVRFGHNNAALQLFKQMWQQGVKVNKITFLSTLSACASPAYLADGKLIHTCIMDSGLEEDVTVGTALFQMYGKCQSAEDARKLFTRLPERDLVAWNAMIAVFSQHGNRKTALELLAEMKQDGLQPDKITFVSLLNACSESSALADGKKIHILLDEYGVKVDSTVANALINMYSKCGSLEDAESIFRVFPERDVISWNTMLTAYCHYGQSKAAVQLFGQMQREGVEIDNVTIVSILDACANLADLQEGSLIHAAVLKKRMAIDSVMATALVNMYGKCANLVEAQVVFDEVLERDGILWAAIMAAYAQHGRGEVVLQFFAQMQKECLKPDKISMIHLLHVCSHCGLLEEGFHYFNSIAPNSKPVADHYVCMVDLLGRVGQLPEAEDFIQSMPFEADAVVWTAFLGACRVHGDIERGRKAAEVLVELDPHNAAPYVILSHIYIAAGRWQDAENVRKLMTDRNVRKEPGQSWISVGNRVHQFVANDKSHFQVKEIYTELNRLNKQLSELGYVSDTNLMLHDVEDEGYELLTVHSEKLAMVFGLISTPSHTSLNVFKNLRVCKDCHTFTKFLSKISQRRIVVRDAIRFHHFQNGFCSCGDYW